jgi:hypothetical protein
MKCAFADDVVGDAAKATGKASEKVVAVKAGAKVVKFLF